jgi:hypothetical protein
VLGSCACYYVIQSTRKGKPNILSVQAVLENAQGREVQKACMGGEEVQAKWLVSTSLIRESSHTALCVPRPLASGLSTPLGNVLFLGFSMGLVSLTLCVGCLREHHSIVVQVSLRALTVQLGNNLLSTREEATLTDSLGPDEQQGRQSPQG